MRDMYSSNCQSGLAAGTRIYRWQNNDQLISISLIADCFFSYRCARFELQIRSVTGWGWAKEMAAGILERKQRNGKRKRNGSRRRLLRKHGKEKEESDEEGGRGRGRERDEEGGRGRGRGRERERGRGKERDEEGAPSSKKKRRQSPARKKKREEKHGFPKTRKKRSFLTKPLP